MWVELLLSSSCCCCCFPPFLLGWCCFSFSFFGVEVLLALFFLGVLVLHQKPLNSNMGEKLPIDMAGFGACCNAFFHAPPGALFWYTET